MPIENAPWLTMLMRHWEKMKICAASRMGGMDLHFTDMETAVWWVKHVTDALENEERMKIIDALDIFSLEFYNANRNDIWEDVLRNFFYMPEFLENHTLDATAVKKLVDEGRQLRVLGVISIDAANFS